MDFETLKLETAGRVATVTIDRPEKRNALNAQVRRELLAALDALEADENARVVVLTGAGEKAFVAGADISEFADRTPIEQRAAMEGRRVFAAIAAFPRPVIASDQRVRPRRRLRARPRVRPPDRRPVGPPWTAGGQPRHSPGRRRDAAAAAPGRPRPRHAPRAHRANSSEPRKQSGSASSTKWWMTAGSESAPASSPSPSRVILRWR